MIERARKRLSKRAKKGFRGWPLATVALYGPDDSTATKLTVGIVPAEDAEATDLRRWFSKERTDIRDDIRATEEVLAFITDAGAKSVVMTDRIIGCPHEEGIDYEGATCPACLFWAEGPLDRRTPAPVGISACVSCPFMPPFATRLTSSVISLPAARSRPKRRSVPDMGSHHRGLRSARFPNPAPR